MMKQVGTGGRLWEKGKCVSQWEHEESALVSPMQGKQEGKYV